MSEPVLHDWVETTPAPSTVRQVPAPEPRLDTMSLVVEAVFETESDVVVAFDVVALPMMVRLPLIVEEAAMKPPLKVERLVTVREFRVAKPAEERVPKVAPPVALN